MKERTVFIPRALRGNAVEVTFLANGKDYSVSTIGGLDGHSHMKVLSLRATRAEAMKQWREVCSRCERCYLRKHPEERNKPTTEPFLTEWMALHRQHLKALREGKKDPLRLGDAAKLADAKDAVYRREWANRFPMFATAQDAAKALRKAGVNAHARKGVVQVTVSGKSK